METKNIRAKHHEHRLEKIKQKKMHKLLFEDEDEVIDLKTSTKWLTKGNISAQHEGMITKLQEGIVKECQSVNT